jgi:hypothetical protein
MTTREKHIAQKKKEIEKITKQQVRLVKKAVAIPLKPSKRLSVNLRRLGKMMAIGMQIRALEMQKLMIIAQPIPRPIPCYVPGGVVPVGPAIVGESGKELILSPNGNINVSIPNQHPDPHQQPSGPVRPVPGVDTGPDL